jgi:carbon monoxide dehydrogenase subunit G
VKLEGTRSFAAPRATVWEVLNDPERMAKTMPGVESFDVQDERRWSAKVKIPLGLGGLQMSIKFEKTDERELEYAKLDAKGTGVGALMQMTTEFNLADEGSGTSMHWQADVRIAGPVGSMGQRVLQPIVNQQVTNVLAALDGQVQEAHGKGQPHGTGSSAAEEGLHPASPETYKPAPEGPTHSTEDSRS